MVLKYQEQESTARGSVPDAPIDNAYIVGCSGFIYTGASIVSEETRPPSAALIVSAGPTPFPFQHLTPDSKPDPRQQRIRQLLESGRDLTLTDLARELGTSYFWASRLMTEVFGMSLRDYKSWQKLQRVFHLLHSKHSITEVAHAAGFTDSAHLSRTYQRWFGQPPSYSRNRNNVRVMRCR